MHLTQDDLRPIFHGMATTSKTLIDVAAELGTEKACLAYLEAVRWPGGVACLKCGSVRISKVLSTVRNRRTGEVTKERHVYNCLEKLCKAQFTSTSGTLFHDSHLPLTKWFMAVALMMNAKKGLSAKQMERDLGVNYRTAWYLCHRIRKAMEQPEGFFSGVVEIDETFIGGAYDKRRKRERWDKQAVMGFVQRGKAGEVSKVRAFPIRGTGKRTLNPAVHANVSPDADLVCTDEFAAYKTLGREGFKHEAVKHIALEWVRPSEIGPIHTNSIENFWSLFKRGLVGSFHQVSRKHLPRYLDEFSYRFSNRAADLFTMTTTGLLANPQIRPPRNG
jgi:transposase-like protein